jgi:uncharacterized protein
MSINALCHVEYQVTDIDRAQAFFEGLFGWDFRRFTDEMVVFGQGDAHIGGLQKVAVVEVGTSPSLWFKVTDLDEMSAKARALGGTADESKHPVPGVGWSLSVQDPDGNSVGLVQYDE